MTKRWAAALLALALVLGACGGGDGDDVAVGVAPIPKSLLPNSILGLRVDAEDLSAQLAKAERPYAKAAGLFSLREEDDELQATLQVTQFDPDADVGDADLQGTLLQQVAKSTPIRLQMGEVPIYMSRADRQSVAVWFTDEYFFILSTRDTYEIPRTLLRTLTELEGLS